MASEKTNKISAVRVTDESATPREIIGPIEGYLQKPIVSLEDAVGPLVDIVPDIKTVVSIVKLKCCDPKDDLSIDQSASIMLYTYEAPTKENSVYFILNNTLRSEDRNSLKPWFLYLRLIMSALDKLPSIKAHAYRGIRADLHTLYPQNLSFTWWAFTSCTSMLNVLNESGFLDLCGDRMLFNVTCLSGKDIKSHSWIPNEHEIVLLPNTKFVVKSCVPAGNRLHIIHIEQVDPDERRKQPLVNCEKHPDERLKYWCYDDNTLLCVDCILFEHKNHNYELANDFVKKKHETVQKLLLKTKSNIDERLERVQVMNQNEAGVDDVIKHTFSLIRNIIDENEKRIKQRITSIDETNKKKFTSFESNLKCIKQQLIKVEDDIKADITAGNAIDFISSYKDFDETCKRVDEQIRTIALPNLIKYSIEGTKTIESVILQCLKSLYLRDISIPIRGASIDSSARWLLNGVTVAGGHTSGESLNQLSYPSGLYVDDEGTVFISEWKNNRVVAWQEKAVCGKLVAGGNGKGSRLDQLYCPTDLIVHKETKHLFICDHGNRRVVKWPLKGERIGCIVIHNIYCNGITMDNHGFIYVSDIEHHCVRKYSTIDLSITVVAGISGSGNALHQLHNPYYIAIDQNQSLYISDNKNHRVIRWLAGDDTGSVALSGQSQTNSQPQLRDPLGIVVDQSGNIFIADAGNNRIIRILKENDVGEVIIGGSGAGNRPNQLNRPNGLAFDSYGNLYVVEENNHRVQRFDIIAS